MDQLDLRSALITGANAGIGREVARQLASREGMQRIYLACRNKDKAETAKRTLEQATGKFIFEIVIMDVSTIRSVRSALGSVREPIDAIVMNAGGSGGKDPMTLTQDGVTRIFGGNVLGHVALLEELIDSGRLTKAAVYLGSEAARGVPKMRMKRPELATSSVQDFVDVCTGKDFTGKKFDPALAYGEVKYVAALWMAAAARQNPGLHLVTVSPGNTHGTNIVDGFPAPVPVRFLIKHVAMPYVAPLFGLAHSLQTGARRIVAGLTDASLKSGVFYASKADTLTGPVVDQSDIFPDLANSAFQDHAYEAIHRFVDRTRDGLH